MLRALPKLALTLAIAIWAVSQYMTMRSEAFVDVPTNSVQCPCAGTLPLANAGTHAVNLHVVNDYAWLNWSYFTSAMLMLVSVVLMSISTLSKQPPVALAQQAENAESKLPD